MDFNVVVVVNRAQNIVTRNGMTAVGEDVVVDVSLTDDDRFLLVEALVNGEKFFRCSVLCPLFLCVLFVEERPIASPARRG